jgi:hypothetical protein
MNRRPFSNAVRHTLKRVWPDLCFARLLLGLACRRGEREARDVRFLASNVRHVGLGLAGGVLFVGLTLFWIGMTGVHLFHPPSGLVLFRDVAGLVSMASMAGVMLFQVLIHHRHLEDTRLLVMNRLGLVRGEVDDLRVHQTLLRTLPDAPAAPRRPRL